MRKADFQECHFVIVVCPYCISEIELAESDFCYNEGEEIDCSFCDKTFELGKSI